MSVASFHSAAIIGLEAQLVHVEVDSYEALESPRRVIVGLPDASVKESEHRVFTAIKNSGYNTLKISSTINLAPGDLKKQGPLYDLPIALGILSSSNLIKGSILHDYLIVGELALNGDLRPVTGALAITILAKEIGKKGILLPVDNAEEASAIPGIEIVPISKLNEVAQFVSDPKKFPTLLDSSASLKLENQKPSIDFKDIKGQEHVKRAMEIAAAGGHNILLSGPPGSGKTMIAKALIGIMPNLTIEEALETTKVHSIAGFLPHGKGIVTERPFRSPHHTASYAGLIGGGTSPRPGEVSLAHNGVLFLDELPEFSRTTLEVLRQPLEDRCVSISRANGNFTFPTDFVCLCAMNPCPCGNSGHPDKICKCLPLQIERYRGKISGPLLDRIDLHIDVPALRFQEMVEKKEGESSETVKERVVRARAIQKERFKSSKNNSHMTKNDLKKHCLLDSESLELLRYAIDDLGISARAHDRILKVARSVADLAGSKNVCREHLMEAIHYRTQLSESEKQRESHLSLESSIPSS